MNKRRRRIAKARRSEARAFRELREWAHSASTRAPRRGRLRAPIRLLMQGLFLRAILVHGANNVSPAGVYEFARRLLRDRIVHPGQSFSTFWKVYLADMRQFEVRP